MKQAIIIVLILLSLIIAYSAIQTTSHDELPVIQEPASFNILINDFGLVDYNEKTIGYLSARVISNTNASLDLVLLPDEPKSKIYRINDYSYSQEKGRIVRELTSNLSIYGLSIDSIRLEDSFSKNNSVIIIPSDSIPSDLSNGSLQKLIENNVVIFFGAPLDVGMDASGSQVYLENKIYDDLDVTFNNYFDPHIDGPKVFPVANASVLEYDNGWFVIYPDEKLTAGELAELILLEKWQSNGLGDSFNLVNGSTTFFSSAAPRTDYYMRYLYSANQSIFGMNQFQLIQNQQGRLVISERADDYRYTYELESDNQYPVNYKFQLHFLKNGEIVQKIDITPITMKNFSRESGIIRPNVTSGSYVVKLVDQQGSTRASTFFKIPELKIRLTRIANNVHTFLITKDGKPATSVPIKLTVNGKESFSIYTDEAGEAETSFVLSPGIHNFTVEVEGDKAITYYRKEGDDFGLLSYIAIILLSLLVVGFISIKNKQKKKWYIRTYVRPPTFSKSVRVPYETFLQIYDMTQENRSKGLPISISDFKIGLRKYSSFKGAPLFVTESNLYLVVDDLAKDGLFLSYQGYFMPADSANGKPIEYWVVKRKISDYFIEHGEELASSKESDFLVDKKLVHIYHDIDPKKLVKLCKKDNIVIFPDGKSKDDFIRKLHTYDPDWMKLLLEYQYGNLFCETLEEFLERGLSVKK